MSEYFDRFLAISRRKADAELIRKWEWDARFNGDKNIKNQASNARRAATSMQKAYDQFSNLKPEHELAIKAAASALRSIAQDLSLLAAWAKDYHTFCETERSKKEAEELEALAQARWGSDAQAFTFESDLLTELRTRDGQLAFAAWCHGAGKYTDCKLEDIQCDVRNFPPSANQRLRISAMIREVAERRHANKWDGRNGPTVICSWADYEAYVDFRKEVAKSSERIVRMAGSN